MGIRAVAAGSLTDGIDRETDPASPEAKDFERSEPIRQLAAARGVSTAYLAHQYALTMTGVDTLVLGVKDRKELSECLAVEKAGPLDSATIQEIDASLSA